MDTETTTVPNGITQLGPCWELIYPSGQPVDTGDGCPHYDSEGEAKADAPGFAVPSLGGQPVPHQLEGLCFTASARCGAVCDETMIMHLRSREEAVQNALDGEWKLRDGWLRCDPDCDAGCNEA